MSKNLKGKNNPNYGNRWSKALRIRVGRIVKKRWQNKEKRKKYLKIFKEKIWNNKERNRKLSESAKKRTGSKNPFYGKKHTKKALKKIGEGSKNKFTPKYIKKIRQSIKQTENYHLG